MSSHLENHHMSVEFKFMNAQKAIGRYNNLIIAVAFKMSVIGSEMISIDTSVKTHSHSNVEV